jgi:hypothetical protein
VSVRASRDGGDAREPRGGPRGLRAVAEILLPRADRDLIVGDLEELYALRERREGRRRATLMYLRDSLGSVVARRFGRASQLPDRPSTRPPRRSGLLSSLGMDFRLASRSLLQRPGFSALVVVTLALGIGATTAVFGLANQLVLKPLPGIRDPNGAAYLQFRGGSAISALDFLDLRREASATVEGLAAHGRIGLQVRVREDDRPADVMASWIHG